MEEFSDPFSDCEHEDGRANDADRPHCDRAECDEDDAKGGHRRGVAGCGELRRMEGVPARRVLVEWFWSCR